MAEIQILMGVCDGADYLPAQLESLSAQSHESWKLIAGDDSPGPESRVLIDRFGADIPQKVRVLEAPKCGSALNFLHLICATKSGPVAFSDQDDVWMEDKLARAVFALERVPDHIPTLYCARVTPWDGVRKWPVTPALTRPISFANALIENVAMGNTIVLNSAAAELARQIAPKVSTLFAHDWWLYQLITGVGGKVIRDDGPPVLLYRQHENNQIGSGNGLMAQINRKRAVMAGAFAERLELNAKALRPAVEVFTPENAALFHSFEKARSLFGVSRLRALANLGVYRQRRLGTAGFFGAAALGRV